MANVREMVRRVELQNDRRTIYVFRFQDRVKIGITRDLEERLRGFTQVLGPIELLAEFPGTLVDEARFLARFAEHRLFGEWFTAAPELLAWAAAIHTTHRRAR